MKTSYWEHCTQYLKKIKSVTFYCFSVVRGCFGFSSLLWRCNPTNLADSPTTAFCFCGECGRDFKVFLKAFPHDRGVLQIFILKREFAFFAISSFFVMLLRKLFGTFSFLLSSFDLILNYLILHD